MFQNPADPEPVQVIAIPAPTLFYWHVDGLAANTAYAYRVYGPGGDAVTESLGHRFNGNKVLIDPYTRGNVDALWDANAAKDGTDNAANGEDSGDKDNISRNYGIEGPSSDPQIEALRKRQIRNFLSILFLSQGVPRKLVPFLSGHDVHTVVSRGWGGIQNGALLALLGREGFDVFLTGDKNMPYQQALAGRPFAVLILSAINWPVIRPHVDKTAAAITAGIAFPPEDGAPLGKRERLDVSASAYQCIASCVPPSRLMTMFLPRHKPLPEAPEKRSARFCRTWPAAGCAPRPSSGPARTCRRLSRCRRRRPASPWRRFAGPGARNDEVASA